MAFTGTVTLNSSAVQGAVVYAVNQSDDTLTGTSTTDSSGNYSIDDSGVSSDHHLFVEYDDSGTLYNALTEQNVPPGSTTDFQLRSYTTPSRNSVDIQNQIPAQPTNLQATIQ